MASTPTFASTPKVGGCLWTSTTTANTKNDGTATAVGTDILLAYTAGASGAYIDRVRLQAVASAAASTTTATVARIYLSTVTSGATTNTNTRLWNEIALPAQSADQTTTALFPYDIPMGIRIAASSTILFSMHHAAAANTSWQVTVIASDY